MRQDSRAKRWSGAGGFSLIELVVVIVLLGIIASAAAQRVGGNSVFTSRAVTDDLREKLRLARQAALDWQCYVNVYSFDSTEFDIVANKPVWGPTSIEFFYNAADCRNPNRGFMSDKVPDISNPGENLRIVFDRSTTLKNPFSLVFTPLGQPREAFSETILTNVIEIQIDEVEPIKIYPETGAIF